MSVAKQTTRVKKVKEPSKPHDEPFMERVLFPHQIETVELMERFEREQCSVCPDTGFIHHASYGSLCNPIGSGKTSTVLKLIKNDKLTFENIESLTIHYNDKTLIGDPKHLFFKKDQSDTKNLVLYPIDVNIVICNKPLTVVWKKESEYMGVTSVTIDLPGQLKDLKTFTERITPLLSVKNGLLIVASHLYRDVLNYIRSLIGNDYVVDYRSYLSPKRIILDDIHSIQKFSYGLYNVAPLFIWSVNSTPGLVRWDYIDRCIGPKILTRPNVRGFNNIGHIIQVDISENFYKLPDINVHRQNYKRNDVGKVLSEHIPQYIKDMLETGDFDGAYREMLSEARGITGENNDIESVVSTRKPIHELVKIKYMREVDNLNERKRRLIENGWDTDNIDESIKHILSKMDILEKRLVSLNEEVVECPICMDEIERGKMVTTKCCFNSFCRDCIINGCFRTNKTCPLCRKGICQMDIYTLSSDGTAIDLDLSEIARERSKRLNNMNLPSTPMDALMNLVLSKPQGKFVVFNPNMGSSKTFKTFFQGSGITFEDLSGSVISIQRRLKDFEDGRLKVLFLNLRSSNAGLNLQFATDVVIIDSKTILNEGSSQYSQSIGRVRRFPRMEPIPVHYISPIQ